MNLIIELRTESMEWVFIEKLHQSTSNEIATYLKRLKSIYPDSLFRACDSESGKIVDLI